MWISILLLVFNLNNNCLILIKIRIKKIVFSI